MQMIDVLKRLAELDAQTPAIDTGLKVVKPDNGIVVKESQQVEECGIMPEMGMTPQHPPMPASINITAGSGEELSDMLTAIMTLAGVNKGAEPAGDMTQGPATPPPAVASTDGEEMRSVIDKLNPPEDGQDDQDDQEDDQEETDEEYNNTPNDPTDTNEFDAEQHAHHENPPGADRKGNAINPRAYDTNEGIEARLMSEYQAFINEA